jgi:hypothetical protein
MNSPTLTLAAHPVNTITPGVVRVREEEVQNEVDLDPIGALLPMFSPTTATPPVNTITPGVVRFNTIKPGVVRVREEEVQNEEEPIEVQIRKKRQSPGIGSHRTLYSGSSDDPSDKDHKKATSRYKLYQQNGGMVNGSNLSLSHVITSSVVLTAFADRNGGGTNSDKGRGEETQDKTMLKLENIILELFEGSKVAEMLNAWAIFNPSAPVDIPYQSLDVEEIMLIIHCCTTLGDGSEGSQEALRWTDVNGVEKEVEARKNGYKTVQKLMGAINQLSAEGGVGTPTASVRAVNFLKNIYNPLSNYKMSISCFDSLIGSI